MNHRDSRKSTQSASSDARPRGGRPTGAKSAAASRLHAFADEPDDGARRRVTFFALLAIGLAALAVYANSFSGAFVLDDDPWIANNPSIHHLWPIWPVLAPDSGVGGRPVASLTLALNYAAGGTDVWGYHAVNLAIHILAAWTLFGVARRTLRMPVLHNRFAAAATPLALAITLIWTVHPLQTQAVTYIIQRTESLVGLFYLLTLYCVIRGAAAGVRGQGSGAREESGGSSESPASLKPQASSLKPLLWYFAAAIASLMGMATKEVMVTAPFVVLLYDRTFLAGSFRRAIAERWGLYLALAAGWGALAGLVAASGFRGNTAGFKVEGFTWWSYLLTQNGVLVHYLRLSFWPTGLCLDYGWPAADSLNKVIKIIPQGLIVLGLLGLTGWALVMRPVWGFLGAWFFLILAPSSSFMPIKDAAFEQRMYLPLAAVVALVVLGVALLIDRSEARTSRPGGPPRAAPWLAPVAILLVVLVGLGWTTLIRNEDYRDEITMLQDSIRKSPHSARSHNNLAFHLTEQEKLDEAIGHLRIALEIEPTFVSALINYGSALSKQGRDDLAIAQYEKALKIAKDDREVSEIRYNLGLSLSRRGKLDLAVAQFKEVLKLRTGQFYVPAYDDLAIALFRQKQTDLAIEQWKTALKLDPDFAEAHYNLANALDSLGKPDLAIAEWRRAIEARPGYAEARCNLGRALEKRGQMSQAIEQWQLALKSDPNYLKARIKLGLALSNQGDIQDANVQWREAIRRSKPSDAVLLYEAATLLVNSPNASPITAGAAVELAQAAAKLTNGRDPSILNTWAAACAEAGHFFEAAQIAAQAIKLAADQNNSALANEIRGRLRQYEERIPKHASPAGSSAP